MVKHPAEVFGYACAAVSPEARNHRRNYWCPFTDQKCNKQSRLIDYPMGVCSVQYGGDAIALCPRRFLHHSRVFQDIADHYFNARTDLLVFSEVGLKKIGNFDYVMVKHKPLRSEIEDFVIIEFQTGQTTSTGELVRGLEDFIRGQDIHGRNYGFGLNMADIWKRTFTQILNKGIVLEQWNIKIYWVIQEPVYQDFLDRYNLHSMTFDPGNGVIFTIYDLEPEGEGYQLIPTRMQSATVDDLFYAFRNNPKIPSKGDFIKRLEEKLQARMELRLDIH